MEGSMEAKSRLEERLRAFPLSVRTRRPPSWDAEENLPSTKELEKAMSALLEEIAAETDMPREKYWQLESAIAAYGLLCLKKITKKKEQHCVEDQPQNQRDAPPVEFCCPLSSALLESPATDSVEEAYELSALEDGHDHGGQTCAEPYQLFSHPNLPLNQLIHEMICQWCKDHDINPPPCTESPIVRGPLDIIHVLSSELHRRDAAKELVLLSQHSISFRARINETPQFFPELLNLVYKHEIDELTWIDLLRALLVLSIDKTNKYFSSNPDQAIYLARDALMLGDMETKIAAAAALFNLLAVSSNKPTVVRTNAVELLVNLLRQGSNVAKKEAASAVLCFCEDHDNRVRLLDAEIVKYYSQQNLSAETVVDESLVILEKLSTEELAIEHMDGTEAVVLMLDVINSDAREQNKEAAAAILCRISKGNSVRLSDTESVRDI